ncbi:MAG: GBS Bsp-like repeat-containing protein, partial [Lachnospiraceae bacterium]
KGVDYKIAYTNNTNVGTAAMKITGKGNYTGTITKKYRIRAVSLRNVVLSTASRMYTGKAQEPSPAVTARVDGKVVTLVKGTDYTVSYKNNTAPGIATVTVTGIGNFQGTVEKTFEIVRVKIAGSGANRTVTFASGNAAYDALRAAVWTEQNGQDDLTWYAMQKKKSGIWILKIDLVNFKTYGPANVHIYAGDALVYKVSLSIDHQDWLTTQSNRFKSEFLFGTNPYANIDYIQCAINVANNNYYGYGHTWRINRHTISCAGFVGLCLTYCGYGDLIKDDPPEIIDGVRWGYLDLGKYSGKYDWKDIMVNEIGATWHPGLDGIQPGDVLYYDYSLTVNHTGFYLGNGYSVESRAPYTQPSLNDDDGAEIAVYSDTFSRYQWQGYFRIPNKKKAW